MKTITVVITFQGDDYDDVCDSLFLEDATTNPEGFDWEIVEVKR